MPSIFKLSGTVCFHYKICTVFHFNMVFRYPKIKGHMYQQQQLWTAKVVRFFWKTLYSTVQYLEMASSAALDSNRRYLADSTNCGGIIHNYWHASHFRYNIQRSTNPAVANDRMIVRNGKFKMRKDHFVLPGHFKWRVFLKKDHQRLNTFKYRKKINRNHIL